MLTGGNGSSVGRILPAPLARTVCEMVCDGGIYIKLPGPGMAPPDNTRQRTARFLIHPTVRKGCRTITTTPVGTYAHDANAQDVSLFLLLWLFCIVLC